MFCCLLFKALNTDLGKFGTYRQAGICSITQEIICLVYSPRNLYLISCNPKAQAHVVT